MLWDAVGGSVLGSHHLDRIAFQAVVTVLIFLPWALQRRLSELRWFSLAALVCVVILVTTLLGEAISKVSNDGLPQHMPLAQFDLSLFEALPILSAWCLRGVVSTGVEYLYLSLSFNPLSSNVEILYSDCLYISI
jgi:hypothetical protein